MAITLKESFRYQNKLDDLLKQSERLLIKTGFIFNTVEEHLRSKVNKDDADEVVEKSNNEEYPFTPNELFDFIMDVVDEKQRLTDAIGTAKLRCEWNIDGMILMNKTKRDLIPFFTSLSKKQSSETLKRNCGTGFKFNVNNEQVAYKYDINEITTINYNRDTVRAFAKKLSKETDEKSNQIELLYLQTEVDFKPKYDYDLDIENDGIPSSSDTINS